MATSGRAIFQAHVDGVLPESIPIDEQWTLTGAVLEIRSSVTLANGDNTITIPNGTKVIDFTPPTTNANALKLKQTGTDSGFVLQPNMPNILTWSMGGLVINAGGSTPGCRFVFLA